MTLILLLLLLFFFAYTLIYVDMSRLRRKHWRFWRAVTTDREYHLLKSTYIFVIDKENLWTATRKLYGQPQVKLCNINISALHNINTFSRAESSRSVYWQTPPVTDVSKNRNAFIFLVKSKRSLLRVPHPEDKGKCLPVGTAYYLRRLGIFSNFAMINSTLASAVLTATEYSHLLSDDRVVKIRSKIVNISRFIFSSTLVIFSAASCVVKRLVSVSHHVFYWTVTVSVISCVVLNG